MRKITTAVFAAFTLCVGALVSMAQDPTVASAAGDKYVISAKAGGVGYVEGNVAIVRKNGPSGRLLKGDTVQIGDRISTDADGLAEILLNPGSYLRLAGNSAFEFKSTSLDDLQLRVDRGSAIFEVFAGGDFLVTVSAPRAKFKLINSGVFRLDVTSDGAGILSIWKGRAQVGRTTAGIFKAGQAVKVAGSEVGLATFKRDKGDEFDQWSKSRGKQLAKITNNLKRRDLRDLLLNSYNGRQWNMYNSFGLWVFDRFSGSYCFLPFGYGWSSPYGYGFGHYIGWYDIPWSGSHPPTPGPGGSPSVPQNTSIVSSGDRSPIPPFVRMQGGSGNGRESTGGGRGRGFPVDSAPTYSPPVFSPPPAPTKMDPPPTATTKDGH